MWSHLHDDEVMAANIPPVTALGRISLDSDEPDARLSRKPRQLLAVLVAAGPRGGSMHLLADQLWSDELPAGWEAAWRMGVARLRKVLRAALAPDGNPTDLSDWPILCEGQVYRLALDAEQIDVWRLAELAAAKSAPVSEDDLAWSLAGTPFADIEIPPPMVDRATAVSAQQMEVTLRFCDASPPDLRPETVARLIGFQRREPYDERLAVAIGRCLIGAGEHAKARAYLGAAAGVFADDLGAVPQVISELITEANTVGLSPVPEDVTGLEPVAATPSVPPELERFADSPLYGRDTELEALLAERHVLLVGPSGAGKSRLVAAVAEREIEAGNVVSLLAVPQGPTVSYGPIIAAFPGLRDVLLTGLPAIGGDRAEFDAWERAAEATRWLAARDYLEELGDGRPHRVLVDDAHRLDAASANLLEFLARSRTSPVSYLVVGRNDLGRAEPSQIVSRFEDSGFTRIEIGGLDRDGLAELARAAWPGVSARVQRGLAQDLLEVTDGLPALAIPLLEAVDPVTMMLPDRSGPLRHATDDRTRAWLSRHVADVGPSTLGVAVAGAVLGEAFTMNDVMELTQVDEETAIATLGELFASGHLVDGPEAHIFQFRHAVIREAFRQAVPPVYRNKLNRMAAELVVGDVHRRADHLAGAGALVDREVAVAALEASAREYFADGAWRAVVRQLRRAARISRSGLGLPSLVMNAIALDLSGVDGHLPRRQAFDQASSQQRWADALDAALSGLPAAEQPDGDPVRIEMLEQIPVGELDDHLRFEHAENLARQHSLLGNPAAAVRWLDQAAASASSDEELVRVHLTRWTVQHHIQPVDHQFPTDLSARVGPWARARMRQMEAIAAYAAGDRDGSLEFHREFSELAGEVGDPLRIWHAKVFDAMVAMDDGHWRHGNLLADEAYEFGYQFGMQQAWAVRAGQRFHEAWVAGRHGTLVDSFGRTRAQVEHSSLGVAALAVIRAGAGEEAAAWEEVEPVLVDALERPRSPSIVVVALLSGLAARQAEPDLADRVRAKLSEFADMSIVTGFGFATIGPVWRLLAAFTDDPREARSYLERAVEAAEGQGVTWQVLTRRALALATGDQGALAEARRRAVGTDLVELFD